MFERKCLLCGKPFSDGTPASRKYCDDCLEIRREEARIRHRNKEREKARQKAAAKKAAEMANKPKTLRKKDMVYCSKCIYRGRFTAGYLCNYYCLTGSRRGTKAGDGCKRREIIASDSIIKRCERCGSSFVGTKQSHICQECRRLVCIQNAKKASAALAARRENENG